MIEEKDKKKWEERLRQIGLAIDMHEKKIVNLETEKQKLHGWIQVGKVK